MSAIETPPPADEPKAAPDRRVVLALTVLVLWLGVVKVLDSRKPEPVAPDGTEQEEEPDPMPDEPAEAAEPVEIGTPPEPGWTLSYTEKLSPTELRWSDITETNDEDGTHRDYRGKLTLRFGEGLTDAFPIIDAEVVVEPRPAFLRAMVDSGTLEVEFKGHDPVVRQLPWVVATPASAPSPSPSPSPEGGE